MSNSYNVTWEKKSDSDLVKRQAWYVGNAIDSQIKNNQQVQAELENDGAVFFKLQSGRFSAENADGKELGSSNAAIFRDYPDVLVHGVRNEKDGVSLSLDSENRELLQERQLSQQQSLDRRTHER